MLQGRSFLKRCAWCSSNDAQLVVPSSRPIPNGTRFEEELVEEAEAASDNQCTVDSPSCVASATALASPQCGQASCAATALSERNSGVQHEVLDAVLQCGHDAPDPGLPAPFQDNSDDDQFSLPAFLRDNLDNDQFMKRVVQLQTKVDFKFSHVPLAGVPHLPTYKGSPLWAKQSEPDSDTDVDMPELIAAPSWLGEVSFHSDALMSASDDNFDDCNEDSPLPFSKMQGGGLGSCWGPGALREALQAAALDDSPTKDALEPQPF